MKCKNCGYDIVSESLKFCPQCGRKIKPGFRDRLVAVGKSFAYLGLFFGVQLIVSFVYMVYISFGAAITYAENNISEIDAAEMVNDVTNLIYSQIHIIVILSFAITIFTLTVFFRARGKRLTIETQIKPVAPLKLLPIIPGAIAVHFVVTYVLNVLLLDVVGDSSTTAMLFDESNIFISVISTAILTPILEEIIFRGLIFSRLNRVFSTSTAVIISSVMFGVSHVLPIQVAYATVLGIIMALLRIKYNSLMAPIWFHAVFNVSNLLPYMYLDTTTMLNPYIFVIFIACLGLIWLTYHMIRRMDMSAVVVKKKDDDDN